MSKHDTAHKLPDKQTEENKISVWNCLSMISQINEVSESNWKSIDIHQRMLINEINKVKRDHLQRIDFIRILANCDHLRTSSPFTTHGYENIFTCRYCQKMYQNHKKLTKHMSTTHSHEKPWNCIFCNKKFISIFLRNKHQKEHIKSKKLPILPRIFDNHK